MVYTTSDKALLKKLGIHVRQLRESKGMSQQQFADKCEIEKSTIARIERGISNTTVCTLSIIAKHLEIQLWEILKFESTDTHQKK